MFENLKKKTQGRTTYNNSVVLSIVTLAVAEVEGVAPDGALENDKRQNAEKYLQRIKLDMLEENTIYVDLSIYVYSGYSVPDVAFKVQEAVKNGIENMTSFKLSAVDLRIIGVVQKPLAQGEK